MPKTKPKPFSKFVKDLTGQKYGRLTVISFVYFSKHGNATWLCKCNCGKMVNVKAGSLHSNHTKSCGCLKREQASKRSYKHGHSGNRKDAASVEYNAWTGMVKRCKNPKNRKYKYWGGRGVTVCKRWLNSFPSFLADMGTRPGPGYSIDRIDNDGNYEPGNCRWATAKQQNNNLRPRKKKTVKR